MSEENIFKERLIYSCRRKGFKQIELAEKVGIDRRAINHYFRGRVKPKNDVLYKMAEALDVSPSWLMGFDTPMDDTTYSIDNRIRKKLQNLTLEELEKVLQLLELMFPERSDKDG